MSFVAFFFYACAEGGLEDPQARVQARGHVVGRGFGAYAEIKSGLPVSPFSPLIDSSFFLDFYHYVCIFLFFSSSSYLLSVSFLLFFGVSFSLLSAFVVIFCLFLLSICLLIFLHFLFYIWYCFT